MEELLPKLLELGVLGTINILLVFRGVPALNELSQSNKALAESINKLNENMNSRLTNIERDLRDIKASLDFVLRRFDLYEKTKNN